MRKEQGHEPRLRRNNFGHKMPVYWYKRYPGAYLEGTRNLSPMARLIYSEAIDRLVIAGEPLAARSQQAWADLFGVSRKIWRAAILELQDTGKLWILEGGEIENRRCWLIRNGNDDDEGDRHEEEIAARDRLKMIDHAGPVGHKRASQDKNGPHGTSQSSKINALPTPIE